MVTVNPVECELVKWITGNGGYVNSKLSLMAPVGDEEIGERGVVAMEAISEGEQLLLIPISLCLYRPAEGEKVYDTTAKDAVEFLQREGKELRRDVQQVLLLLSQLALGSKSYYAPYLASLPKSANYMMHGWTEEEKQHLQGTSLWQRSDISGVFMDTVAPALGRPGGESIWPDLTAAAFRDQLGLVQSRMFHMRAENWVTGQAVETDDMYCIPAVDMLNHSTRPELRSTSLDFLRTPIEVETEGRTIRLESCFSLKANRDVAAGEEVLHSYGELSDSQLLQVYGFVETWPQGGEGNPHNYVWLPAKALADAVAEATGGKQQQQQQQRGKKKSKGAKQREWPPPARQSLLQRLGLSPDHFVLRADALLTDELVTYAAVLCMDEGDFDEYQQQAEQEMKQQQRQQQQGEGAAAAAAAAAATAAVAQASGSGANSSAPLASPPEGCLLGAHTLRGDPDFGMLVCMALLRVLDAALKRYPTSVKEDEVLMATQEQRSGQGATALSANSRAAVQVRLGEKRILSKARGAAIKMLMQLQEEGDRDDEDEDDGKDDDDDDEGDDSSGEEEDGSEEEVEEEVVVKQAAAPPPGHKRGSKAGAGQHKRQRA